MIFCLCRQKIMIISSMIFLSHITTSLSHIFCLCRQKIMLSMAHVLWILAEPHHHFVCMTLVMFVKRRRREPGDEVLFGLDWVSALIHPALSKSLSFILIFVPMFSSSSSSLSSYVFIIMILKAYMPAWSLNCTRANSIHADLIQDYHDPWWGLSWSYPLSWSYWWWWRWWWFDLPSDKISCKTLGQTNHCCLCRPISKPDNDNYDDDDDDDDDVDLYSSGECDDGVFVD